MGAVRSSFWVLVLVVTFLLGCGDELTSGSSEGFCVSLLPQATACDADTDCEVGFRCYEGSFCAVVCTSASQCGGSECFGVEEGAPGAPDLNNENNGANNENNDANNDPPENLGPDYSCDYMPSGMYMPAEGDACNLIAQDGCGDGEACYNQTDTGAQCFTAGDNKCGAQCTNGNDCQASTLCIRLNEMDAGYCMVMCEVGTPCPSGATCSGLTGRDDIGICTP